MSLVAQLVRVQRLFAAGAPETSEDTVEALYHFSLATATPKKRQEAKQAILSLVETLVAFGQRFAAQYDAGSLPNVAQSQGSVAWRALLACCDLIRAVPLEPADSLRLLAGGSLLFSVGPILLRFMAAQEQREPTASRRFILGQAMMQLRLFASLTDIALAHDTSGNLGAVFACTTAKPAVFLPWLIALANALQHISSGPDVDEDGRYITLSDYLQLLKLVLGVAAWKRHGDELLAWPAARQALMACLLQQVLPVLAARMEAAVARGVSWESVQRQGAASVAVSSLWQGDEPGMARSGASLPPGGSDDWLGALLGSADTRLFYELHLASGYASILQASQQPDWRQAAAAIPVLARIAAALPQPRPPAMPHQTFATLHGSLASLLALCCVRVRAAAGNLPQLPPTAGTSTASSSVTAQQLDSAAWEAVRLVPYMARTLRAVAADLPATAGRIADLSALYTSALLLLFPAGPLPNNSIKSWEQVSAWATAADAGLRLLPLLANTAVTSSGHSPARSLATPILSWLCFQGAVLALPWCKQSALPPQASLEAMACQLWQLHSSAARLAHLLTGGSGTPSLDPAVATAWSGIGCELLHHAFAAADILLHAVEGQSSNLRSQALCAAHLEALQAVRDVHPDSVPRMLDALMLIAWGCPCLIGPAYLALARRLLQVAQASLENQQSKGMSCIRLLTDNVPRGTLLRKAAAFAEAGIFEQLAVALAESVSSMISLLNESASEQVQELRGPSGPALAAERLQAMQAALDVLRHAQDDLDLQPQEAPISESGQPLQVLRPLLTAAAGLAPLLREHWAQQAEADRLAAAQAAAARSCAYLRCANLDSEVGPAAGEGMGSQRCSACRAVWYCGTACSHADWRAGHRRVCKALGAARQAEKEARRAAKG